MHPFEQYQELKADLVSIAMNLGPAVEAHRHNSMIYWHIELIRTVHHTEQLREWIMTRPEHRS